jgi:cholesterol oxidase
MKFPEELDMEDTYDVVVIGSGFGGAVTACRLSQAGRSVCVLERGRRWRKEEFPRTTGQVTKAFWDPDRSYGFLEYRAFKRIDVIQGCGVGGGSLPYFNVQFRPPPEIFEKRGWPGNVTGNSLGPYFDLVKDMLDAGPLAPPTGRKLPARTEAFLAAARAARKVSGFVDIALHTGPDRLNPHGGVPQSACVYSGNCMLGCHVHAKNTLDLNYIPMAEKYGARVFPLHMAEKIMREPSGGYRVQFRRFDESRQGCSEPGSVVGRTIIVSAGTLGSTELLLRCRDEHRTLPGLSRALGSRFSGNGDFLLAGTLDADRDVDPGYGPSITAYADFSTPRNRITIEDLGFPDPVFWLIEGAMPRGSRLRDMVLFLKTYLLRSLGIGVKSSRVSDEIEAMLAGGRTSRFLPYLGMGTDAADGSLRLHNGVIDIAWSHRKSRRLFREIEAAMRDLSLGLNGKYLTSLLWWWPLRKLLTAHPLGGCIMGNEPGGSVVNHCGEVWNHPGLYVADGSVIPTALSVNPSMTIAAIAERTAFWIRHGREMRQHDPESPRNR